MNELLSRLPAINKAHPESLLGRGSDVLSSHLDYSICSWSDRRGICGLGFYLTREDVASVKGGTCGEKVGSICVVLTLFTREPKEREKRGERKAREGMQRWTVERGAPHS